MPDLAVGVPARLGHPGQGAWPGVMARCIWLAVFVSVLSWSGIAPYDRFTWLLEVLPAVLALGLLVASWSRFPLTPLVYWLILAHAVVLMVGGHYTYARVPAFDWLRDAFELSRNHYDRVGHFFQGFVPALVIRELLLRTSTLRRGGWLFVLTISACLAVSALYELIEWGVALASGTAAEAFLGTQGDVWDTQSDMFLCLVGTLVALPSLSALHDRQLARLGVA